MIEVKIKNKKINKINILKDVSFKISKGEIIGLVGENGAGKSSIMKIITGLTKQFTGSVTYNNKIIDNDLIFSSFIESPKFIENISGADNIKIFSILANHPITDSLNNLIDAWGLKKHLNKKVKNYSFGTKQKLGLIITFLFNREYLIIDEPTNGMDDDSRRHLFAYLKSLQEEGTSILISSHNLNEINEICNRVIKVKNGTIEDENYIFTKLITIKIDDKAIEDIKKEFTVVTISEGNITIEYCEDFIKKLFNMELKYKGIELISINNYYRRKI
jgi:ABC-2 type transport system ATP-binding protein